jgi:hypothetical protein
MVLISFYGYVTRGNGEAPIFSDSIGPTKLNPMGVRGLQESSTLHRQPNDQGNTVIGERSSSNRQQSKSKLWQSNSTNRYIWFLATKLMRGQSEPVGDDGNGTPVGSCRIGACLCRASHRRSRSVTSTSCRDKVASAFCALRVLSESGTKSKI